MEPIENMIVAGGGPAGLSAAIYAGRAGLSPLVFEGVAPGGQLAREERIDNYPGFPDGVSGAELAAAMRKQAERFGARFEPGVELAGFERAPGWSIDVRTGDGRTIRTRTLVGATGSSPRKLAIPGEAKYTGRGVSYCATCDGAFFRGRHVVVVGGGTAGLAAVRVLSPLCASVVVVSDSPPESEARIANAFGPGSNVKLLTRRRAAEVLGDGAKVTGIRVTGAEGSETVSADGVFVAVGQTPSVAWGGGQLELDRHGRIRTWGGATNVPGVFAAGDACEPVLRQVVTA
ncbi:MAG: FAD-dependent oxidoreductase, partial [Kiritimatiellae bacterium]|nr:FAD-dependent oxidoreductase [Kiritimatiellia bacterium]